MVIITTIEQLQKDFEAGIIIGQKRDGYTYFRCKISGARWEVVKLTDGSKKIIYEVLGGNAWSYAELDAALKETSEKQAEKNFINIQAVAVEKIIVEYGFYQPATEVLFKYPQLRDFLNWMVDKKWLSFEKIINPHSPIGVTFRFTLIDKISVIENIETLIQVHGLNDINFEEVSLV